jgi:hypothetical protein
MFHPGCSEGYHYGIPIFPLNKAGLYHAEACVNLSLSLSRFHGSAEEDRIQTAVSSLCKPPKMLDIRLGTPYSIVM